MAEKKKYPTIRQEHYYTYIDFLVEFGTHYTGVRKANTLMLQMLGLTEEDRKWVSQKFRVANPNYHFGKDEYKQYYDTQFYIKVAKVANHIDGSLNSDRLDLSEVMDKVKTAILEGDLNNEQNTELFFRTLAESRELRKEHLEISTFILEYEHARRQLNASHPAGEGDAGGGGSDDAQNGDGTQR